MQKSELTKTLLEIAELIALGQDQQAYDRYVVIVEGICVPGYEMGKADRSSFYEAFVRFLADQQVYEEIFRQLRFAAEYGLDKNARNQIVYDQLVAPYVDCLQENYRKNSCRLGESFNAGALPSFGDLRYWTLPTANKNEFFLYDPEIAEVLDKFHFAPEVASRTSGKASKEFDIMLADCRNWNELFEWSEFARQRQKNCYALVDAGYLLSALAGIDLFDADLPRVKIFARAEAISDYFLGNSESLPWTIIGPFGKKAPLRKMLKQVHAARLKPDNRKGNDILLSICMPSFNRGERAYENVLHCLSCCFDEEIEIVVSNNGSDNESAHFYDKIRQLEDSRMVYFAFEQNQGFALNLCKVCDLARGKYTLLLSDEDLIDLNGLTALMSALREIGDNCAAVRIKGTTLANAFMVGTFDAGMPAYEINLFSTNYMSGLIFNTALLQGHKATDFIRNNQHNLVCVHYPHMYLEVLLCQYGSLHCLDIFLITEGAVETTNMEGMELGNTQHITEHHYFSLESRLNQHRGFKDILLTLEICQDVTILFLLYFKLCTKTFILMRASIATFYRYSDVSSGELLQKTKEYCIELLEEMYDERKIANKKIEAANRKFIDELYEEFLEKVEKYEAS